MRRQWKHYLLALSFALGATSNALADGPTFTTIDFPGAASTQPWGINTRGDIVGLYETGGVTHGFLLSGGQFSTIDFPDATGTEAYAINPRGDIGGVYTVAGARHGFVLSGGNTPRLISPTLRPPKSIRSTLAATSWGTTYWPARAMAIC